MTALLEEVYHSVALDEQDAFREYVETFYQTYLTTNRKTIYDRFSYSEQLDFYQKGLLLLAESDNGNQTTDRMNLITETHSEMKNFITSYCKRIEKLISIKPFRPLTPGEQFRFYSQANELLGKPNGKLLTDQIK